MQRKFAVIKQEVILPAEPSEVFEALVDPQKHSAFTGLPASGEAKVGRSFMAGNGYITGKYIHISPGKEIVQEWKTKEWPKGFPPSILKISLLKTKEGTMLRLNQTKVPYSQAEYYRKGWIEYYWEPMKRYLLNKAKT
ncbi:MAG: SRPBCC domain-containing protein [Conexivisphaerales archaeon]